MRFVQLIHRIAIMLSLRVIWHDRRAVTSVEYVLIAVIIVVAIVGVVSSIGGHLGTYFNNVNAEF